MEERGKRREDETSTEELRELVADAGSRARARGVLRLDVVVVRAEAVADLVRERDLAHRLRLRLALVLHARAMRAYDLRFYESRVFLLLMFIFVAYVYVDVYSHSSCRATLAHVSVLLHAFETRGTVYTRTYSEHLNYKYVLYCKRIPTYQSSDDAAVRGTLFARAFSTSINGSTVQTAITVTRVQATPTSTVGLGCNLSI